MAVFLYSRVSTDEQSVANQKLSAKTAGFAIDHFYSDEGVSGSTDATSRTQYSAMCANLVSGDTVVVTEISRLGRKTEDVLMNIRKFEEMSVKVCVLNFGNLDLTSPMGKAVTTMSMAFYELELNELRRRTRAGMARVKDEGTKLGQPLKIAPGTLEAIVADKKSGMTLDKLAAKHSIVKSTLHTNLLKWGDNLAGYRTEFNLRQAQYALKAQQ